ncbi:MAG: hypothetical protein ACTSSI_09385 [Candidatus Helarchaeota archaeon]
MGVETLAGSTGSVYFKKVETKPEGLDFEIRVASTRTPYRFVIHAARRDFSAPR